MPELSERIDSVQAGVWGAIALASLEGGRLGVQTQLATQFPWNQLPSAPFWLTIAIALGSGFLFGVAYRYIVRDDSNPHLRQGAVWAFSGVRMGAMLEAHPQWLLEPHFRWVAIAVLLETIMVFSLTSLALETALQRQWLEPLKLKLK